MNFRVKFGIHCENIDITNIVLQRCIKENIVFIPGDDAKRVELFTDPLYRVRKQILIYDNSGNVIECHNKDAFIDTIKDNVFISDIPEYIKDIFPNIYEMLHKFHCNLKLDYGSFQDEMPEQLMSVEFLTGNEKVLEIGGNIGRNSLIIASILKKKGNNQFVSLETDPDICKQLIHNRDSNGFDFHIENSALSKKRLIQKDWKTIPSDELLEGYKEVNIIDFETLQEKYDILFDTLILDCEGAFYHILKDMPEILNNIKMIIVENDYPHVSEKNYVDEVLKSKYFHRAFVRNGLAWAPCYANFYEVWKLC